MSNNGMLLSALISRFGGSLIGSDLRIEGIASLNQANEKQLSFLTDSQLKEKAHQTRACSLIVGKDFVIEDDSKSFIVCGNPYLYYAKVARYFHPLKMSNGKKHPSAVVQSKLDDSVEIGANVYIAEQVKVGANSRILAGVVIENNVTMGNNCLIHPNVTILQGCILGDNVEIHSGTVIGSDGFGFAFDNGVWEKIPQVGAVEIHDNVEIGSNVSIDRGALDNTIIHKGVKIDNLVQIAHNCEVGEGSAIAAMVGMAGSTKIGKYCRIAGAVKFTGHLSVADNTFIAGATIVSRSIEKLGGQYAGSYPFQEYQVWKYNAVYLKKLRNMHRRLKKLEQSREKIK